MCERLRGHWSRLGLLRLQKKESGQGAHLPPQDVPDKGRCRGGREVLHQAGTNLRHCVKVQGP